MELGFLSTRGNMSDLDIMEAFEYPLPKGEPCKGLVFRGYSNTFKSNNHIGQHQGIKLLKRKSCPGCEVCGSLLDEVSESIACNSLIMPTIHHGALYSIHITNVHKDWESGLVDDYEIEVYKLSAQ